ncbi:MAG: ABC transporter permease [Gammaproteobacteria bacterium]|nr:ABC transporter permease [Gammaproteobacteria bacterium]
MMGQSKKDFQRLFIYTLSPVALLLVWEMLARTGAIDARFFPAPSSIIYHLLFVSPSEGILTDIQYSVYRISVGYVLGCLIGMTLGIAMGLSKAVRLMFYPIIIATYPIPKIAILPLIMLIFGIGEMSKIVVVAIGCFFLVLINTLHGVDSLEKIYRDVAAVYKITKRNFIFSIAFPRALPSIFTGLKLAIGYSLVIVVAAEFSGADKGIGYLIWQSWETFSIKSMYAGIFVIGLLGFLFSYSLDLLERRLIPWLEKQ